MGFGEFGKVAFVHKNYDIGILEEPDLDNVVKRNRSILQESME